MSNLPFAPAYSVNSSSQQGPKNSNLKKITDRIKHIFAFANFSDTGSFNSTSSTSPLFSRRKWRNSLKRSSLIPGIIVAIFILFGIFMIANAIRNSGTITTSNILKGDDRVAIQKPKAQQAIERAYEFSIKDASGIEVSKLKLNVQNTELRDEIVVKGQKATSIKGRTFLIVNMKITNNFNKAVQINSRDYIRLSMNNAGEKLAPDIHNDPVEIQAISTKYTRVGFPINDTDKDLALQIGEINGKKETIELNLR